AGRDAACKLGRNRRGEAILERLIVGGGFGASSRGAQKHDEEDADRTNSKQAGESLAGTNHVARLTRPGDAPPCIPTLQSIRNKTTAHPRARRPIGQSFREYAWQIWRFEAYHRGQRLHSRGYARSR